MYSFIVLSIIMVNHIFLYVIIAITACCLTRHRLFSRRSLILHSMEALRLRSSLKKLCLISRDAIFFAFVILP